MSEKAATKRILSGVQPTGNLHLGNYLGAIRNWVKLQQEYECFFMLADLHAITVPQEAAKLRANVRETAAAFIACGVDPEKHAVFPQSAVSAHAELMWVLSCHTPLGWLNRMTQFKDKVRASLKLEFSGDVDKDELEIFKQVFSSAKKKVLLENDKKVSPSIKLGLFAYPVLMAADII